MFEDFFDKFEPGELFVLGGICVFLVFIVECFFEYFFERHIDKRLKTLERIILDKSKVVINIEDFEAYCSSKFARSKSLDNSESKGE